MMGDADYLLHIAVADTADFERIYKAYLSRFPRCRQHPLACCVKDRDQEHHPSTTVLSGGVWAGYRMGSGLFNCIKSPNHCDTFGFNANNQA